MCSPSDQVPLEKCPRSMATADRSGVDQSGCYPQHNPNAGQSPRRGIPHGKALARGNRDMRHLHARARLGAAREPGRAAAGSEVADGPRGDPAAPVAGRQHRRVLLPGRDLDRPAHRRHHDAPHPERGLRHRAGLVAGRQADRLRPRRDRARSCSSPTARTSRCRSRSPSAGPTPSTSSNSPPTASDCSGRSASTARRTASPGSTSTPAT